MISAKAQQPECPVCHKTDQVRKLQDVYNEGTSRFAPPSMPGKTVSILRYILFSVFIVGICVFAILIFVGSESFGMTFSIPELILVVVTFVCIVTALVLSYVAFTKVVQGDQEASKHYSDWDRALANWNRLRYCSRDDVVFDPQTGKTISEEALKSLLATEVDKQQATKRSTTLAR